MKNRIFVLAIIILSSCTYYPHEKDFVQVKGTQFTINNEHFFPIGENIGWLGSISDYDYYFRRLSENGANTVRIIMVPWDTDIEWEKLGEYNKTRIERLDSILKLAEDHGLKVILSLDIYGELRNQSHDPREMLWENNPYNSKNGGPCATPDEFFSNGHAKESYKKRLGLIVNRHKNNPAIFAYEFWNEVDLTDNYDRANVIEWHKEMADHIRAIDKNHLITTSFANHEYDVEIWNIMDFSQLHYHDKDVVREMPNLIKVRQKISKPVIFSEFSLGTNPDINLNDSYGEALHDGLWIASMHGVSAFPWWWDEYIEEKGLYHHFAALSDYWENESLNEGYLGYYPDISCDCSVYGLMNATNRYLYVKANNEGYFLNTKVPVEGNFTARIYNTSNGGIISIVNLSGTLIIPDFSTDIAVKLQKIIKI